MALPSSYKLLEYIQSSGTQYIDTGFSPNQNTRVVMKVNVPSQPTAASAIFGARTSGTSNAYTLFWINGSAAWCIDYSTSSTRHAFTEVATSGELNIDYNKNTATINDESYTWTETTFQAPGSMALLACNSNGTVAQKIAAKLYSCQIYDNGTLIRDYVPVERISDGAVGLYDLVNDAFYANAGTGAFTPGYIPIGASRMLLMDGTGYDILGGKVLVDGTAYDIKKGRVLIDGTGYDIGFGKRLSDVEVGGSVYINVNGVPTEFLIVHKGLPSSMYDDSCDGIWLLMKDIYTTHTWFSSEKNNSYKDATIHTYLNNTFLNLLDADIQGLIQQAKIPYINGDALSVTNVSSGANGLSTKIFLLGAIEAGFTVEDNLTQTGGELVAKDGACLDYFAGCDGSAADPKRVAYYNGAATDWWLRSPLYYNSLGVLAVYKDGRLYYYYTYDSKSLGVRPALILPHDTKIDDEFNIIA